MAEQQQLEPFPGEFPDIVIRRILKRSSFDELRSLRLACRNWNSLVIGCAMKSSLPKLCIAFSTNAEIEKEKDYNYFILNNDIEALQTILSRHIKTRNLVIKVNGLLELSKLAANISVMKKLEYVYLKGFVIAGEDLECFKEISCISKIHFEQCDYDGSNFDVFGDELRSIHLIYCHQLQRENLFQAFQAYKRREIPLESVVIESDGQWGILRKPEISLTKFCLENFPSLLMLTSPYGDFPVELDSMVATDLNFLTIHGPLAFDQDSRNDFLYRLFINPLPNLKSLVVGPHMEALILKRCFRSCSPHSLLSLQFGTNCPAETFLESLIRFTNLKTLSIEGQTEFAFEDLVTMVQFLMNFEEINLSHCAVPSDQEMKIASAKLSQVCQERLIGFHLFLNLLVFRPRDNGSEFWRACLKSHKIFVKNTSKPKVVKFSLKVHEL